MLRPIVQFRQSSKSKTCIILSFLALFFHSRRLLMPHSFLGEPWILTFLFFSLEQGAPFGLEQVDMWRSGILLCCVATHVATSAAFGAVPLHPIASRSLPRQPCMQQQPVVKAPVGFSPPEPKPLQATGDLSGLFSASLSLACRFGAGITVAGWSPKVSFQPPEPGQYGLKLGPFYLADTSAVIRGECPRPNGTLFLYEFDSSPYCRKVRDACAILDLRVHFLPCPGALPGSKYSDELYARTGRRTVPYLIDEGKGVEMFESDDIINHLFANYGPPTKSPLPPKTGFNTVGTDLPAKQQSSISRIFSAPTAHEKFRIVMSSTVEKLQLLGVHSPARGLYLDTVPWQLQGTVAVISAGMAATIRMIPAYKMQIDARPDNGNMKPLTLYGYEASPFVRPVSIELLSKHRY